MGSNLHDVIYERSLTSYVTSMIYTFKKILQPDMKLFYPRISDVLSLSFQKNLGIHGLFFQKNLSNDAFLLRIEFVDLLKVYL